MQKLIGCQCSEYQLQEVGCECVAMTVEVWPMGYASVEGTKRVQMAHGIDYAAHARKLFGGWATVCSKRETFPMKKNQTFSAEYIREMSIGG